MVVTRATLAVFVTAVAALPGAVASAQQPSTDPGAGSPAGAIYQLPLDQARIDAAPKHPKAKPSSGSGDAGSRSSGGGARSGGNSGSGAGTGSGGSTTTPTSPLRSENGFGSSSIVPGTEPTGGTAVGGRNGAGAGANGAGIGSATGSGAARPSAGADAIAARTTASGAPSSTRVYLFLALVLAIGIAGGLATRYRPRRTSASG